MTKTSFTKNADSKPYRESLPTVSGALYERLCCALELKNPSGAYRRSSPSVICNVRRILAEECFSTRGFFKIGKKKTIFSKKFSTCQEKRSKTPRARTLQSYTRRPKRSSQQCRDYFFSMYQRNFAIVSAIVSGETMRPKPDSPQLNRPSSGPIMTTPSSTRR